MPSNPETAYLVLSRFYEAGRNSGFLQNDPVPPVGCSPDELEAWMNGLSDANRMLAYDE